MNVSRALFLLFITLNVSYGQKKSTEKTVDFFLNQSEPGSALQYLTENRASLKVDFFTNRLLEALAIAHQTDSLQKLYSLLKAKSQLRSKYENSYFQYLAAVHQKDTLQLKKLSTIHELTIEHSLLKAKVYHELGNIQFDHSKFIESFESLTKALNLFQKDSINTYLKIAEVRGTLAVIHKLYQEYEEATLNNTLAIRIIEQSPFPKKEMAAKYYNNLGNVYNELLNYPLAEQNYTKSLKLKESLQDSLSLSNTIHNIGTFYSKFGNLVKAQDYYTKSLKLINQQNLSTNKRVPQYYSNIGAMYYESGENQLALEFNYKALTLSSKTLEPNDRLVFTTNYNIGKLLARLGKESESEKYFHNAEKYLLTYPKQFLNKTLFLKIDKGILLSNVLSKRQYQGFIHELDLIKTNDYEKSMYFHLVLNTLGTQLLNERKYDSANYYFKLNYTRNKTFFKYNNSILCADLNNIGMVFFLSHEVDSAADYFNKSIAQNTTLNAQVEVYSDPVEFILSQSYLLKIELNKYLHSKLKLIDLQQNLKRAELVQQVIEEKRSSLSNIQDQLNFGKKVFDFYESAIQLIYQIYLDTKNPEIANQLFYYMEATKAQSLLLSLGGKNLQYFSEVPSALIHHESELNKNLRLINYQLIKQLSSTTENDQTLLQQSINEYKLNQQNHNRFLDSLKNNLPDYYNLKYNKKIISTSEIQRDILKPSTALIEYHLGDHELYGQVITRDKQFIFHVPKSILIKSQIVSLKNHITYQMDNEFHKNSYELYRSVFYPVDSFFRSEKLPIKEIIIVTSDILGYLPFEALIRKIPTPKSSPDYLIKSFSISYTYSATLLWQKNSHSKTWSEKSNGFIGFSPTFGQNISENTLASRSIESSEFSDTRKSHNDFTFSPLQETYNEITQIGNLFKEKKLPQQISNAEYADEQSVKRSKLYSYRYIHFATHGFIDMQSPHLSGIALTRNSASIEDDILYGDEVYNLKLNADLVCLSACETGLGKIYKGEGIIGLTRGFLYAGARNVVVSLWKVPDKSTSILMTDFYKNLFQNSTNTASLRKAKLKMLRSKLYSRPYYWAPFVLIGQ